MAQGDFIRVTLSPSAVLRINSAKDLPSVAHLGETVRQAQGDTLGELLRQSPARERRAGFVRNFTNVGRLPYVIIPAESLLKLDDALCLMTISANMA